MPEQTPAFELVDASTHYDGIEALSGVSLRVAPRTVTAIVGVNGAGKSTTLSLIAGLMPLRGEARFRGEPCSPRPRRVIRPGIALSPEGRRLFPQMSVEENLLVGGFRAGKDQLGERLARVYETFPLLHERRRQKAGTLSGGEQQMAAIGRALMSGPELLLLDEPTLGLAPKMTAAVAGLIREIAETGMTIVLVEQDIHVALDLASYAYALSAGRVVDEGSSEELRERDSLRESLLTGRSADDGR